MYGYCLRMFRFPSYPLTPQLTGDRDRSLMLDGVASPMLQSSENTASEFVTCMLWTSAMNEEKVSESGTENGGSSGCRISHDSARALSDLNIYHHIAGEGLGDCVPEHDSRVARCTPHSPIIHSSAWQALLPLDKRHRQRDPFRRILLK